MSLTLEAQIAAEADARTHRPPLDDGCEINTKQGVRPFGGPGFNVQDALREGRFDRLELDREAPPLAETVTVAEAAVVMPDWEAHLCLEKITATQLRLAEIDRLAKQMKAEAITDLKDFLGNYDRPSRLKAWRAAKTTKSRKKVTTLHGELSETTVAARCVVADVGLALPYLKEHCPSAVEERVVAKNLPKPETGCNEDGEIAFFAPGPGLKAEPEREELTVNGKRLDVLLRGKTEGDSDE